MHECDCCLTEVGVRFRIFRDIINLNQMQIAEEVGASTAEIDDIENGRIYPNIAYLYYLHEEYGLNINWLLGKVGSIFNNKDPKKLGAIYSRRPYAGHTRNTGKAAAPGNNGADGNAGNTGNSGEAGNAVGGQQLVDRAELLELMEIPLVRDTIMATLLEMKELLKKQAQFPPLIQAKKKS